MRSRLIATLFLLASSTLLPAQMPKAFDVAAIKLSDSSSPGFSADMLPGGRFVGHNLTLQFLIPYSYGVRPWRVSGLPSWSGDPYDINAKADTPKEMSESEVKPLLCALLEARFHLSVRKEPKETQVFSLVVAKNGSKLHASATGEEFSSKFVAGKWTLKNIPLTTLANALSGHQNVLTRVTDDTGIEGKFNFEFVWQPEDPAAPSIFTILEEQFGLKLIAKKGMDDFLVVEHIERPSEN